MIREPRPPHRRYRHRPGLRLREAHPTIVARVLVAILMGAVLYVTVVHLAR